MNKRWRGLGAAAGIAAVAAGILWWRGRGASDPQYNLARLERGNIVERVTATGTVNPITTVLVGSQVSGTIKKLYADFNSAVRRGQILAQLDTDTFESQVAQAAANLQTARAQVENAKASLENFRAALLSAQANLTSVRANAEKARVSEKDAKDNRDRQTALWQRNLIAQRDVEVANTAYELAVAQKRVVEAQVQQAEADLEAARARVQSAQAQIKTNEAQVAQAAAALRQAQINLEKATIYSPIDGIVVARNVDVGQTVAASLQAPTLFIIALDLSRLQIDTSVPEADVGRIQEGQEVQFTVDAFPSQTFRGRVSQVRLNPTTVQNVVTYNAVVTVENPGKRLMPGMTAQVSIITSRKDNVLRLPVQATRFRPPTPVGGGEKSPVARKGSGGQKRQTVERDRMQVWMLGQGGSLQPVSVQTGISDGRFTEIVSGSLKEGDQVIIGLRSATANSGGPPGAPPMFRRF
ncbi:MAG: efflux RND transporter periplasmic adaptor subunit [Candidatus Tectomicrobia bacterium]|uniref:Efflux RND transporter periplasmic adaptor subunit n=1 Tax=Tectimicrobiota bacterium TaxID=2528274 RepID=A0A932GQZ3_UNCTE|nr:efflux RND transporter periplasmic adaptor subunit [Candidatus Tectomicrobia bacterium]